MSIASRITSIEGHISDIYDSVELTGVDTTDIDKNLVNVPNTLKEGYIDIINNGTDTLYNNFPKVSGEGTSLTLNNTYQAPMRNNLKGNTSQTGTPTPTNPIPVNAVSGDNKITINSKNQLETYNISGTYNGVSYTLQDGVLTLNGTCTASGAFTGLGIFRQSKGINYKWTYVYESGSCTDYGGGLFMGATPTSTTSAGYGAGFRVSQSRTVGTFNNGEEHIYYLYITLNTNSTYTNYKVKPLIVQGNDYSYDFEPYQGNTYNIDLPVENLFDNDLQDNLAHPNCTYSYVNGEIVVSATGSDCYLGEQTSVGQSWSSIKGQLIEVEPNTTYTYSITNPMFAKNFVVFYDSNKVSTKSNYIRQALYTFTTESTTKYISMRIGNENSVSGTTYKLNVMLEKGSKTNTYQPYGTTPMELCKIGNYQDYFYKDSDKWYLHKEIGKNIYTGASGEVWTYYQGIVFINDTNIRDLGEVTNVSLLSNLFQAGAGKMYIGHSTHQRLHINLNNFGLTDITNVTQWKTWLSTHNLIVYFIQNLTNTEITDTTLINQLEEFYQAQSKNNQTNISQINNDLGFIISASALKKG